jgi:hypothetical protein
LSIEKFKGLTVDQKTESRRAGLYGLSAIATALFQRNVTKSIMIILEKNLIFRYDDKSNCSII